jgi:hypothetical protein
MVTGIEIDPRERKNQCKKVFGISSNRSIPEAFTTGFEAEQLESQQMAPVTASKLQLPVLLTIRRVGSERNFGVNTRGFMVPQSTLRNKTEVSDDVLRKTQAVVYLSI